MVTTDFYVHSREKPFLSQDGGNKRMIFSHFFLFQIAN